MSTPPARPCWNASPASASNRRRKSYPPAPSQATPSTNLAWVATILGNAAAIQAGPYLTTQTFQVTADVAAVGRYGRGYRRTLFVIDGSTGTPQIVYRHNMASLGVAIGADSLQKLARQQKATQ